MNLSQVQIDSWWIVSCVLVAIGAAAIHIGLGVMLTGVVLGIGCIRADIEMEKENDTKKL